MSRRGSGHSWEPSAMDKAVNTTDDLLVCSKCQDRIRGGDQKIMLKEYINSIEYINSCHSLLNQIVSKQKCENAFTLPDIPNFVNVFSIVYNQFRKKKKKPVHELDNIESLDEIYSRIESLDVNEEVKPGGNTSDTEGEARRNLVNRRRVRKNEISDEENASVASNKRVVRNSSIPRPVSSEKGRRHGEDGERHVSATHSSGRLHRGKYMNSQKVIRHENKAVLLEKSKQRGGELSEEDLEKYAKELLRSRSESPSTPRSLSSNSRSPSPRNRQLNTRVPSRMKLKASVGPKIPTRLQQKLSPTIDVMASKLENMPERNESSVTSDSKMKAQLNNHSADMKRRRIEENEEPVREENGDEDNDQRSVVSPRNSAKTKRGDFSKNAEDPQYVVKQKPNDFFTQRRRLISDIINKPLFPDSDVDTDKEVKAYNSESDIDDDVFEKKSVRSTKSSKAGEVNNTYNLLKMSISRPLSNSVLSNIGILTHSGKIKPEKEEELVRLKNNLSKDKQNASFRQPRNSPRESHLDRAKAKTVSLSGNMSSPSSEIKSDEEEEINSHPMESHAHYHHRRNHY